MLEGLERIRLMDVPDVLPSVDKERLVVQLDSKGAKTAMTQAKRARKKAHWKERKRKQRERMRPYMARKYREEQLPRRKKLAEDGMWWEYYVMEWRKRGLKIETSRDEWDSEVADKIGKDNVPIIFRFNTAKPVRLDNLMIKDADTKQVLFDGQEWLLRKLGAIG